MEKFCDISLYLGSILPASISYPLYHPHPTLTPTHPSTNPLKDICSSPHPLRAYSSALPSFCLRPACVALPGRGQSSCIQYPSSLSLIVWFVKKQTTTIKHLISNTIINHTQSGYNQNIEFISCSLFYLVIHIVFSI